jgi:hypothetical protein
MAPGSLLPADPAAAPSVLDSTRRARSWCLTSRHRPGSRRAFTRARVGPRDQDRFRQRRIEQRWLSWSETPSTGWKLLPSSRRSRRTPCVRAVRPPAPLHPSRLLRASPTRTPSAATESVHTGLTPPTDFCNRQRAWAHRLSGPSFARNPLFQRIPSFRCEPELRTARPPELTLRAPEGKVATGRQRHESACATDRTEAHSQRAAEHLIVARRALFPGSGRPEQRAANPGLTRSAARTVRTFDRPRCFPSPGILAGADPATTVRDDPLPRGERAASIHAFFATPCWLASTGRPEKSNGDEHHPGLVGHQPEPCRTAAPRTTST